MDSMLAASFMMVGIVPGHEPNEFTTPLLRLCRSLERSLL